MILNLILSLILIYLFLSDLPVDSILIQMGVDPSWNYAISQAVIAQLTFGKEIVYMYGPFGYLIAGSSLPENFIPIFVFRNLVSLVFIIISIIRLITIKNKWQKIAFAISIFGLFISIFAANPATDNQLVIMFLLILSFDSLFKSPSQKLCLSLILGSLSGFLLLTKLTSGISTIGLLSLFWIGNSYQCFLENPKQVHFYLSSLFISWISALSVAFLLIHPPDFEINLFKTSLLLILSVALVIVSSKRLNLVNLLIAKRAKNIDIESNNLKLLSFLISYGLLLLLTIYFSSSPLLGYIKGSLQISSGYASAMSLFDETTKIYLGLAVSQIIIVLFILFGIVAKKNLGFALASTWILWITFKHGFIRQDLGHVFIFIAYPLLIVALSLPKIEAFSLKKKTSILYSYLLCIFLFFFITYPYPNGEKYGLISLTNFSFLPYPNTVSIRLSVLRHLKTYQESVFLQNQINLDPLKLPENVQKTINHQTIDIMPGEISLVPANDLRWKPRPVFQSYVAYTEYLDNLNVRSYLEHPRDFILYQFYSIDLIHPSFSEPKTFAFTYCYYQPPSNIPDVIKTEGLPNLILLEHQANHRCLEQPPKITHQTLNWNTPLSIPDTQKPIIAKVKIHYSLFGKLYKTLFRAAPVMLNTTYKDGFVGQYRIIPENANHGLLISHLPRNAEEMLLFFKGELASNVTQISLFAQNPLLYRPKIEIVTQEITLPQ